MKIWIVWVSGLYLGLFGALEALNFENGDFSLLPAPPPKSQLLGITFEETPGKVLSHLSERGLVMKNRNSLDEKRLIQIFDFEGIPSELVIREGETRLTFFRNRLIALDFSFKPTYMNFLLIRAEIFRSLGGRFSLATKKERMDGPLKTHLAHLKSSEYGADTEERIKSTMLSGGTFFHYTLHDKQEEFRSTFVFLAAREEKQVEKKVKLLLNFSLNRGLQEAKEYRKELKESTEGRLLP